MIKIVATNTETGEIIDEIYATGYRLELRTPHPSFSQIVIVADVKTTEEICPLVRKVAKKD
jgi:hypothetical protein